MCSCPCLSSSSSTTGTAAWPAPGWCCGEWAGQGPHHPHHVLWLQGDTGRDLGGIHHPRGHPWVGLVGGPASSLTAICKSKGGRTRPSRGPLWECRGHWGWPGKSSVPRPGPQSDPMAGTQGLPPSSLRPLGDWVTGEPATELRLREHHQNFAPQSLEDCGHHLIGGVFRWPPAQNLGAASPLPTVRPGIPGTTGFNKRILCLKLRKPLKLVRPERVVTYPKSHSPQEMGDAESRPLTLGTTAWSPGSFRRCPGGTWAGHKVS